MLAFLVPLATISGCAGLAGSVSNNPGPSTLSITNVQAISTTTTGAQVSWTTNVAANSVVNYGTTTSYGSSTPFLFRSLNCNPFWFSTGACRASSSTGRRIVGLQ